MTRTTLFLLVLLSLLAGGLGVARPPLGAAFETAGGDAGCNADPNGGCFLEEPTTGEGCNMDPDGKPICMPEE